MGLRSQRCRQCGERYEVKKDDEWLMRGLEVLCTSCRYEKMDDARELADQYEEELKMKMRTGEMFRQDISGMVESYYRSLIAR